jgi:tetratricopeptide (TPR) repeat protein
MTKEIMRYLDSLEIKSEKHLNEVLNDIMKNGVPEILPQNLSISEQAEDLANEAYRSKDYDATFEKLDEALKLDPNCLLAYYYLGKLQVSNIAAELCYQEAVRLGYVQFDAAFEKKHTGNYWLLYETRTFMSCLQALAHIKYANGKDVREVITILEKLILLNPNDNQGNRDFLFALLAKTKDYVKFEKYANLFKDAKDATFLFAQLFLYIQLDLPEEKLKAAFTDAQKENKHFAKLLLNTKQYNDSQPYQHGSKEEAENYCVLAKKMWHSELKCLAWLTKNGSKK